MNEELIKSADACYRLAEKRAADYFRVLKEQVEKKTYVRTLTNDIQSWKQNHIHHPSILSVFSRKKGKTDSKSYYHYIQWLEYTGKLDQYLDRSISYLFMRDLGKALHLPDTQTRVRQVVDRLKNHLVHQAEFETFSLAKLYRMAQKESIESTFIWLIKKLQAVSSNIPNDMEVDHAKRKLIKIIAGVLMHVLEEMGDEIAIAPESRAEKLDQAIRLGYAYGLTYPFIDDLLDAHVLSDQEKKQYSDLIRTTLITGDVPELGEWVGKNKAFIQYIHSELRDAFEYIKANQRQETSQSFLEQAYVFFHSQEVDREKKLSHASYTNEELYLPVILKSSSSRLIVRSVISVPEDEGFDNRTFFYGIYNQLADDFADLFDDLENDAVTPYTYFLKYHEKRPDLINPFELYWAVISYLIHNVYHSDSKTCEVMLDRAINGLKRFKERMGTEKYNQVMELFALGDQTFQQLIQKMVQKASDVEFFDKLLRDHMITILKNERQEQEEFLDTIKTVRKEINNFLYIPKVEHESDPIKDAANYSLTGDGKRLRPIMTYMMGIHEYGLNKSAIVPLLRSLEYMHTASLIFDDLPSQDNAAIRRGRPTIHQVYNIAIAELTGLFLTQKAIEEQASLDQFDPKSVLALIRYSAQMTEDMCRGQAMDLDSKGKQLTLEQLNRLSFFKTGKAFEAALIMPAILANVQEAEMHVLKKFSYHMGIAFQIKDDLLDVEGDTSLLGKNVGKDTENNSSTFVTILGEVGAKKAMWEHYCQAIEVLEEVPRNTAFLKHLLNYIVNRDH